MLEEILKSINQNLERIANSQEETLKFLKKPIKFMNGEIERAVNCVEKASNTTITKETVEGHNCNNATIQQAPIDINLTNPDIVQQPMPVQQSNISQTAVVPPSSPQVVPIAQIQESFTQEQLAVAMSNAVSAGKMNAVREILQRLNVQALTQINPSDYNKLATMLREAGVKV